MKITLNSEIEFFFFLDAWNYCRQQKLSIKKIKRKNWTVWSVLR